MTQLRQLPAFKQKNECIPIHLHMQIKNETDFCLIKSCVKADQLTF